LPSHNQSGILFVGAKDNGEPSGLTITDQLLLSLADMKTDANNRTYEERLASCKMIVSAHDIDITPTVLELLAIGKTSLIYHLAWTFSGFRKRVVVADLDSQANLTSAFLLS
jgi:hypothetical protein